MALYSPSPTVWNPPQAVIQAGDGSHSQYNAYRRIQAGEETQLRVWPSVKKFRDVVMTLFPGFSSGGMKRSPRRDPVVGRIRDPHEEGRAIDFMTRDPNVADPLANWLVTHAADLGVQLVMWRGTEWSASNSLPKWERITGNPHNDHIHMEFNDTVKDITPEEMERRIRAAFSPQAPTIPEPTIEQSEDTPSADVSQENDNVTMLTPDELAGKVSYLQTLEKNKLYIALGVGILILGGIGFILYKHKLKQSKALEAKPINTVKNGRRKNKNIKLRIS